MATLVTFCVLHHTSRNRELLDLEWNGSDHIRRRSPWEGRKSLSHRFKQLDQGASVKDQRGFTFYSQKGSPPFLEELTRIDALRLPEP